jgi:hypothetical protein
MEKSWERFGQKESAWVESIYQGMLALIDVARSGGDRGISYTDFTHRITAIHFDPHSQMLDQLLDDISTLEAAAADRCFQFSFDTKRAICDREPGSTLRLRDWDERPREKTMTQFG